MANSTISRKAMLQGGGSSGGRGQPKGGPPGDQGQGRGGLNLAPESGPGSREDESSIGEDPQSEGRLDGKVGAGSFGPNRGAAPGGACSRAGRVSSAPEALGAGPAARAVFETRGSPGAAGGCGESRPHQRGGRAAPRAESILTSRDQARKKRGLGFYEGCVGFDRVGGGVGGPRHCKNLQMRICKICGLICRFCKNLQTRICKICGFICRLCLP